jgi:DNA-binding IclR family transcriptional regulator
VLRYFFGVSGQSYDKPELLAGSIDLGFMVLPIYRAWVVVASLAICLGTWFLIERTSLGATLRAGTENPALVQAFGINVPLMVTLTYAGGAGAGRDRRRARGADHPGDAADGSSLIIIVFAVVVIGGMGSLDRLARGREPMTLARLASDLALPKSSVHGLCTTLVSFGYLRRQADGTFLIGPRVMGLAEAFVAGTDVAQEFNALWGSGGLVAEETVVLSVLSGNEALYVAVRNGARPLGLAFNVGMRLPAYLSGSGKAMLAQLPAEEVRQRFAGQLSTRLTSKGPRDLESLLRELALTRRRGWSVDDETVREGVASFGAPVFDASGRPVAGVAVCIHKAQLGSDRGARHREAALDVARRLTLRLGGEPPVPAAVRTPRRERPGGSVRVAAGVLR